jgi:hypothetical protein
MNCQFVEREKRNGKRENKPANAMVMMRVYNKRPTINVRQQIQLGADPGIAITKMDSSPFLAWQRLYANIEL